MLAGDLLEHRRVGRGLVGVPPRCDVDGVAKAGEAVACVVEHQCGEVVRGAQAADAIGTLLGAGERPGAELGLVPVQAPVHLDVR
jgi:hypothetical protein